MLLLGSKLPWLACPDTRRHPDECNNQQQTPKKDLFARGVCVPTFSCTSFAVYYRTGSTHIYLCLAFLKMAMYLSKVMFVFGRVLKGALFKID